MLALVTGASSGIGEKIAFYLASLKYDLCVVARDKNKLNYLYKNFSVNVIKIGLDLTKEKNCYKLYEMLKDKNIDILVNNAGFGDAGNFIETSLDKELNMIKLNINAYHILTKLFVKDFVKRNYGRILNIASMASFMPGPYMATYYATKSYILNLSLALSYELKKMDSNVHISIFCPGPVKTNFNKVANSHFNIPSLSSEYVSKYAVDNMFKNKLIIIPPNMKLNRILIKISPYSFILFVNSKIEQRASKEELK